MYVWGHCDGDVTQFDIHFLEQYDLMQIDSSVYELSVSAGSQCAHFREEIKTVGISSR